MKARIKFRKNGVIRFIGHLDVMRYFQKAMRRAGIPIKYSSGYSPHMIMSFAQPLGIGVTSDGEYLDIELTGPIASEEAVERLNREMVEGMEIISFLQIPEEKKYSGMTSIAAADYLVRPKEAGRSLECLESEITAFLEQNEITVLKKTKKGEKETDIRPMILSFLQKEDGIHLRLRAGSEANLKPELLMESFFSFIEKPALALHYHREELYTFEDGAADKLIPLESVGTPIDFSCTYMQ